MPNNVENDLYIIGKPKHRKAVAKAIAGKNGVVDFERIIPIPSEKRARDEYRWFVDHWGTKWNAYESGIVSDDGDVLKITFQTAWDTPDPVIIELAKHHPKITFVMRSFERGMGWQKTLMIAAGSDVMKSSQKYHGPRGG